MGFAPAGAARPENGEHKSMTAFKEMPAAQDNPARYFKAGEILVESFDSFEINKPKMPQSYSVAADPLLYLRLIPCEPITKISRATACDIMRNMKPLRVGKSYSDPNEYGAISYAHHSDKVTAATQLFMTGELWGFNSSLLDAGAIVLSSRYGGQVQSITSVLESGLRHYIDVARDRLGVKAPVIVEAGAAPVRGYLMRERETDAYPRLVRTNTIQHRKTLPDFSDGAIDKMLADIIAAFYDAAGEHPPK
jgi:hypothetical protein